MPALPWPKTLHGFVRRAMPPWPRCGGVAAPPRRQAHACLAAGWARDGAAGRQPGTRRRLFAAHQTAAPRLPPLQHRAWLQGAARGDDPGGSRRHSVGHGCEAAWACAPHRAHAQDRHPLVAGSMPCLLCRWCRGGMPVCALPSGPRSHPRRTPLPPATLASPHQAPTLVRILPILPYSHTASCLMRSEKSSTPSLWTCEPLPLLDSAFKGSWHPAPSCLRACNGWLGCGGAGRSAAEGLGIESSPLGTHPQPRRYVATTDELSLRGMTSKGFAGKHELVVGGFKQVGSAERLVVALLRIWCCCRLSLLHVWCCRVSGVDVRFGVPAWQSGRRCVQAALRAWVCAAPACPLPRPLPCPSLSRRQACKRAPAVCLHAPACLHFPSALADLLDRALAKRRLWRRCGRGGCPPSFLTSRCGTCAPVKW